MHCEGGETDREDAKTDEGRACFLLFRKEEETLGDSVRSALRFKAYLWGRRASATLSRGLTVPVGQASQCHSV